MGIIYILENKENGKCYVGQTNKFNKRFNKHLHSNSYFGNSLRKYGIGNFDKLLLENVPKEELDYWETHYIQECNSIYPNGYNFQTGGCKNKHNHKESNRKNSETQKGEKSHNFGKHLSEETKKKMSEAKKGIVFTEEHKKKIKEKRAFQVFTEETRKKLSEAGMGENNHFYGKHHTEETKKKISEKNKGKISWNKGKHLTEEYKKKISESHKGMRHTEETKQKMSEAKKNKFLEIEGR